MKFAPRFSLAVALACLFLSLFAAVAAQAGSARFLELFLGASRFSTSVILAAFLAGLATGSRWGGSFSRRAGKPLLACAVLMALLAGWSLLFPLGCGLAYDSFLQTAGKLEPGGLGVAILKCFFAVGAALPPAFLAGSLLPLMMTLITGSLAEARKKTGELCCLGSAGAAAGCFAASFWWIPSIGLEMTLYFAGLAQAVAALLAFGWSRALKEGSGRAMTAPEPAAADSSPSSPSLRGAAAALAVSGFTALLYETAWARLLTLILGPAAPIHALAIVCILAGIALGAWLASRWRRAQESLFPLAWAQIALGAIVLLSMFAYGWLPYGFAKAASVLQREAASYRIYEMLQRALCLAVLLAPAACFGAALPLASRAATEKLRSVGESVGSLFAAQAGGAALGALLAGLAALPALGLAGVFALGAATSLSLGIWLLRPQPQPGWQRWGKTGAAAAASILLASVLFTDMWQDTLTLGLYRSAAAPATASDYLKLAHGRKMKHYKDGAEATVSVQSLNPGGPPHDPSALLRVNGRPEASGGGDLAAQLMLGHLPMILRPGAERVLLVGIGSGIAGGAAGSHAALRQLDVVENSADNIEAARLFDFYNQGILDDPRSRVIREDPKTFLQISRSTYDVIISQMSSPWVAGVSRFFSQEHYQACLERLSTNGLMAQWVRAHEASEEVLNTVFATFSSVFPHVALWQGSRQDLILIGSMSPQDAPLAAMMAELGQANVVTSLNRAGLAHPAAFLSLELVPASEGPFLAPPNSAIHSDFYPSLEYAAPLGLFTRSNAKEWRQFDQNFSTRPATRLGEYRKANPLTPEDYQALGRIFVQQPVMSTNLFRSILSGWAAAYPDTLLPLELAALLEDAPDADELQALRLRPQEDAILQRAGEDSELLRMYVVFQMKAYRKQRSAFYLPPSESIEKSAKRLEEIDPASVRLCRLYLGELAWDRGDDTNFFEHAKSGLVHPQGIAPPSAFAADPFTASLTLARLIDGYWSSGKIAEAWEVCGSAMKNGYYNPGTGEGNPLLRMAIEKSRRAFEKQSGAARQTPSP